MISEEFGTGSLYNQSLNDQCAPGQLPFYNRVSQPDLVKWGKVNGVDITVSMNVINEAYNEVVYCRKNLFLVPYGKIGKDFIDELTLLINDWIYETERQHDALKTLFLLQTVSLQKPGPRSNAKEHQDCLKDRLEMWKKGHIDRLLYREGCFIQAKLNSITKSQDQARIFANLIMEGQIKSAMGFLDKDENHGILLQTEEIMNQLRQKHPEVQDAMLRALLFGPVEAIPDRIVCKINGEIVREAALRTKSSSGPSGIDAVGVRKMVTCKSFKASSVKLCDALALFTRNFCMQYVDPVSIKRLIECRLITLDKGDGSARPI